MTIDYVDWKTSDDRALSIYNQTVPLGRKPSALASGSGSIGPAGINNMVLNLTINQPSFQMLIGFSWPNAAVPTPFASITFQWTDSASGFTVASDEAILPGGVATLDFFYISGPARADVLTIQTANLDLLNILSYSYGISQSSHVYQQFRVQEVSQPAVPQFTRAGQNNPMGIIGSFGANIGAGATQDRLCSAWAGPASISVSNIGSTAPFNVLMLDPGIIAGGSPLYGTANSGILFATSVAAGATDKTQLNLPNGPVVLRHVNTGAAAGTLTTTIVRGQMA